MASIADRRVPVQPAALSWPAWTDEVRVGIATDDEGPDEADRRYWAACNVEAHDEPERPRYHVEWLPCTNGYGYGPWAVIDAKDGTIVASFPTPEGAAADLRDMLTPADVWAARWESSAQLDAYQRGHLPC